VALEELLAALVAEAAEESARGDRLAREEAARIVAAARIEAQAIEEEAAHTDEAELALIAERQLAHARAAAAAALRSAREEVFGALLSELRARVAGLRSSARYRSVVRSLVLESIAALPAANLLRVDPRDEALVSEITAELGLAIEVSAELEVLGGIEVSSSDGRTVRNTLEERMTNAEPALRILFGKIWSRDARDAPRPPGDPALEVVP
jgi:V/A-type H+/Na+-transporting ATPase subunit E